MYIPINPLALAGVVAVVILSILTLRAPRNAAQLLGAPFAIPGLLIGQLATLLETIRQPVFDFVKLVFVIRRAATAATDAAEVTIAPPALPAPASDGSRVTIDSAPSLDSPWRSLPFDQTQPPGYGSSVEALQAQRRPFDASHPDPTGGTSESANQPNNPNLVIAVALLHLSFLVAGAIVIVSDFVFAVLRLQAVLFPTLPISPDLASLGDLSGALLVSLAYLTGALFADFFDILPKEAQIFAGLVGKKRQTMLRIAMVTFGLNILVVVLLFAGGQILTSLQATFPLLAIVLAMLLAALQVIVIALSAWGAIRGAGVVAGLAGLVFVIGDAVLATFLRWLSNALKLIGEDYIEQDDGTRVEGLVHTLIFGLNTASRSSGEPRSRPSLKGTMLAAIGIGDHSGGFTEHLATDLTFLQVREGQLVLGVWTGQDDRDRVLHEQFSQLGATNISPSPKDKKPALAALRDNLVREFGRSQLAELRLVWLVDGPRLASCQPVLAEIRQAIPDASITIVCYVSSASDSAAIHQLSAATVPVRDDGSDVRRVAQSIILIDAQSPLFKGLGNDSVEPLLARSLAGILLGPALNPDNQSLDAMVSDMPIDHTPYVALAIGSIGFVIDQPKQGCLFSLFGWLTPRRKPAMPIRDAALRAEKLLDQLLRADYPAAAQPSAAPYVPPNYGRDEPVAGGDTIARAVPLDVRQGFTYVSAFLPLPDVDARFGEFKKSVGTWLQQRGIIALSVLPGEGIDLSSQRPYAKGDRYLQVCIVYGLSELPSLGRASQPGAGAAERQPFRAADQSPWQPAPGQQV